MKFWDSSALVALHVQQRSTGTVRDLFSRDSTALVWCLSDVEIRSALCRLRRAGDLSDEDFQRVVVEFERLFEALHMVSVLDAVRSRAKRLLAVHPLRAAGALQLAAALVGFEDEPIGWEFVCLDHRLSTAASSEGFRIVP